MNLATFIIALIVAGILALAIRSIYRDKKNGRGCPGACNCSNCPRNGQC